MLAANTHSKERRKLENSYLQCLLYDKHPEQWEAARKPYSLFQRWKPKWSPGESRMKNSCPWRGVEEREGWIAHQWGALALQYLRSLSGSTSCPFLQHWPHTNFIWRSKVLDVGVRGEAWGKEPQPQANRGKMHPPNLHRDAGSSQHTCVPATSQIKSALLCQC